MSDFHCFEAFIRERTNNHENLEIFLSLKAIIYKIWNFLYYWSDLTEIFTQYVNSKKQTLFVREFFSI